MRRKLIFFSVLLAIIIGIYLNRTYAHFFNYMNAHSSIDPNIENLYTVAPENNARVTKAIKYAALGDSLTAGIGTENYTQSFPYQLAERIANEGQKVSFLNLGEPGGKASDIIANQLEKALDFKPDLITILIGTNDIFEQVKSEDFTKQLDEIIVKLKSNKPARIIVASVPQLGIYPAMVWPQSEYFDNQAKQINVTIKNIATANQVEFIDLYAYSSNLDKTGENFYSSDSFHPNKNGYQAWAEFFYANYSK